MKGWHFFNREAGRPSLPAHAFPLAVIANRWVLLLMGLRDSSKAGRLSGFQRRRPQVWIVGDPHNIKALCRIDGADRTGQEGNNEADVFEVGSGNPKDYGTSLRSRGSSRSRPR